MAIFDFLKKRKTADIPMPPPPSPPEIAPILKGDIEEIRPPEHEEHLPELPPALPAPQAWKPAPAEEREAGRKISPALLEPRSTEVKVFDRTIHEELEERPEIVRVVPKPTFVAVEDYKRIINDTNTIRSKLMEAENFVRKLSDIKNEEERSFEKWRHQLEDVEKKLNYVDQLIAKAQG